MSKVLRIRVQDDIYSLLTKLAKNSNKSLSRISAEFLAQSIKHETKEINNLNKIIDLTSVMQTQIEKVNSLILMLEQEKESKQLSIPKLIDVLKSLKESIDEIKEGKNE